MFYATFLRKTDFRTQFGRVRRESTQDTPTTPPKKCKKYTRRPFHPLCMTTVTHPAYFTPIAQKRIFHARKRMVEKIQARPAPENDDLREFFTAFSGMDISSHPKQDVGVSTSFSEDLNLSLDCSEYESFDLSPRTVAGGGWTFIEVQFEVPSVPYE